MSQEQNKNLDDLLALLSKENIEKLKDLLNTHSKKQRTMQDWYDEFEKAEKLGVFTSDVEASALNWGCCAIGSRIQKENPDLARILAQEVGKNKLKIHLTKEAKHLGVKFYEAVQDNQVQRAKEIFTEIHKLPRIFKTEEEMKEPQEKITNTISEPIEPQKKKKWWQS